jgi:PAT family beta-lactamase induction signal transducer AmpG
VLQALVILGFAWLAGAGHNPWALAAVIGAESCGVGLGTAAFVAYIASTTHPAYTATQFALFTSLAATPRTLANGLSGFLVEGGDLGIGGATLVHIDALVWERFFLLCFLAALPGMLLLFKIAPLERGELSGGRHRPLGAGRPQGAVATLRHRAGLGPARRQAANPVKSRSRPGRAFPDQLDRRFP